MQRRPTSLPPFMWDTIRDCSSDEHTAHPFINIHTCLCVALALRMRKHSALGEKQKSPKSPACVTWLTWSWSCHASVVVIPIATRPRFRCDTQAAPTSFCRPASWEERLSTLRDDSLSSSRLMVADELLIWEDWRASSSCEWVSDRRTGSQTDTL